MGNRSKRKKYFIHASVQLKYIAVSIVPAVIMTLFCTCFLNMTGDLVFEIQRDAVFDELSAIRKTIGRLEKAATKDTADDVKRLKHILDSFEDTMILTYSDAPKRWNQARVFVFAGLFIVLAGTAILALLYSHRIAGPLFRLRKCILMLSQGKNTQPIRVRKNDEFKELAESLEDLRRMLKDRGLLQSEQRYDFQGFSALKKVG